jgi:hypothetical protein
MSFSTVRRSYGPRAELRLSRPPAAGVIRIATQSSIALTLSVFSKTEYRRIGIKAVVEAKSPACRVGTDAGLV